MKVMHIVGARPNFMKVSPIMSIMAQYPDQIEQVLVHTGQHYDANMSGIFFEDLGLPRPNIYLGIGSGSHASQTAKIMLAFEPVISEYQPDWLCVVGDVNSTFACALVASKMGIPVAHIEAGLRSFDRTMPEEVNRVLTDQISDLLFTTESSANQNLLREGVQPEKIHFVGNVMIDTLIRLLPKANANWLNLLDHKIGTERFVLVTLHRPSNVDNPSVLQDILMALVEIAKDIDVVFPLHPRTQQRIDNLGLGDNLQKIRFLEPLGYLDFLALENHAALIVTDSGGIQEESTFLKIPCLTIRPNTERPVTIELGTNRLVESTTSAILNAVRETLATSALSTISTQHPEFWDGMAATRITQIILSMSR